VFTGLVQAQGQLTIRSRRGDGFRLRIAHDLGPLDLGESIAVNGVCLTVTAWSQREFEADSSTETVARSTLGTIPIGMGLHLERALRVGDRFGGHIVAGHVDGTARLSDSRSAGDSLELVFEQPRDLVVYIAEKGSIAIDGVSLTVNRVTPVHFSVMVVPHTLRSTRLGSLRRGDDVNVEADILARYVVHLARVGLNVDASRPESSVGTDPDAALRKTLQRAGIL